MIGRIAFDNLLQCMARLVNGLTPRLFKSRKQFLNGPNHLTRAFFR
jgi:hypothetical protein